MSPRNVALWGLLGSLVACSCGDEDGPATYSDAEVAYHLDLMTNLAGTPDDLTQPLDEDTCGTVGDSEFRAMGRTGAAHAPLPAAYWEGDDDPELDGCYAANLACTIGPSAGAGYAAVANCVNTSITDRMGEILGNIQGPATPILFGDCGDCNDLHERIYAADGLAFRSNEFTPEGSSVTYTIQRILRPDGHEYGNVDWYYVQDAIADVRSFERSCAVPDALTLTFNDGTEETCTPGSDGDFTTGFSCSVGGRGYQYLPE